MDAKKILWASVSALMLKHYGVENLTRLAKDCKIGPGTATRIKEQKTSVGIDVVQRIAEKFDLQAWHLLVPTFDPENPPVAQTEKEVALYRRLKQLGELIKET